MIILVIAFLSALTSLASVSGAALASFHYSDMPVQDSFRVVVTVTGVEGNCGEELKIIITYKSDTFELCEGDERPLEEQRADPKDPNYPPKYGDSAFFWNERSWNES